MFKPGDIVCISTAEPLEVLLCDGLADKYKTHTLTMLAYSVGVETECLVTEVNVDGAIKLREYDRFVNPRIFHLVQRPKRRKMTEAQISELLGFPVEIVR